MKSCYEVAYGMMSSNPESYVICILSKNVHCASISSRVHDVDWLIDTETNSTCILKVLKLSQNIWFLPRKTLIVFWFMEMDSHLRG